MLRSYAVDIKPILAHNATIIFITVIFSLLGFLPLALYDSDDLFVNWKSEMHSEEIINGDFFTQSSFAAACICTPLLLDNLIDLRIVKTYSFLSSQFMLLASNFLPGVIIYYMRSRGDVSLGKLF